MMNMKIKSCEVCDNQELISVLDLGNHPLCDDLIPISSDRNSQEYPISILLCNNCITAHQEYQVPKRELFPESYHYRSRFTKDVLDGMKGLVTTCIDRYGELEGKTVVDVGCNDGSLLGFFRDHGANTIGVEPTGASDDARSAGHVVFNDYLSSNVVSEIVEKFGNPDIITFTNVFAHIENLNELLDSVEKLASDNTILVIENHYLGAILEGNQFDTFYHEHPRSYSFTSFKFIAQKLGAALTSVEFPSRYGGNIRAIIDFRNRNFEPEDRETLESTEALFAKKFRDMQSKVESWKVKKSKLVRALYEKDGRIRCKAFPGRAAILIKLLNLNADLIEAVYEKPGSMKIGSYVPGTRIPILSDEELFQHSEDQRPILNLAWHISQEIRTYLSSNGVDAEIIDIVETRDFDI